MGETSKIFLSTNSMPETSHYSGFQLIGDNNIQTTLEHLKLLAITSYLLMIIRPECEYTASGCQRKKTHIVI